MLSKMILMMCLALLAIGDLVNTRSSHKRAAAKYTGPGSTPNLPDVFMKRCQEYFTIPSHAGLAFAKQIDCQKIWEAFYDTFAKKDPCKPNSYKAFVDKTSGPPIPNNKALFWSGTPEIAANYANEGQRMVVLANLLTGYLVKDNLVWCGSTSSKDGIEYGNCPLVNKEVNECKPVNPKGSHGEFWEQASKMLAQRTVGTANVLFHGSNPKGFAPYRSDSFFGDIEMPNLSPKVVPEVYAMIVHPKGMKVVENCQGASMQQLQKDIQAKHGGQIKYRCEDDPPELQPYYPF